MKTQEIWVIGLMSGTSFDAVDASLILTDGKKVFQKAGFISIDYPDALRDRIRDIINSEHVKIRDILMLERDITIFHADVVGELLKSSDDAIKSKIGLIGFHGQTIYHDANEGITLQLGNASLLSELTGFSVVSDFRRRDIAAGGQGAPLVPLYHAAITENIEKPIVVVNIGGVANITYITVSDNVIACDVGVGNALLDDLISQRTSDSCDINGKYSASGIVDNVILNEMLNDSFFVSKPPKSLDRNSFVKFLDKVSGLSIQDAAATLVAFTCEGIIKSQDFMNEQPKQWIICGGGRKNPSIMKYLSERINASVVTSDSLNWNGDAIEAEAFAYLAARRYFGLPLSLPTTTGVKSPKCGGSIV